MFLHREAEMPSSGKPICIGLSSGSFALLFCGIRSYDTIEV